MKDKRMHILEEATIPNAVMTMALPSIIGLLVMAVYNIVDTMFVAWLGTQATGATQIVFPLIMSLGAVGLAFGIGGSSYVSRLLGEKNMKMAEEVVSTNFFMALGITQVHNQGKHGLCCCLQRTVSSAERCNTVDL